MGGFVYVWYDRKKTRFYVGSHWGDENDGYVCSSQWMRRSHKNRPQDFKRKIVARVTTSRADLLVEEQRWLHMIKLEELGKRYYNLMNRAGVYWHTHGDGRKTKEKIAASVKAFFETPEGEKVKKKFSRAYTGKKTGPRDPRVGRKISKALKGKPVSEETKEKIHQTLTGRKLSEEHRANIKKSHNRDYSCSEFRRKCSEARIATVARKRLELQSST